MKKQRNSNIELLRILMMLVIVAHHYIVNSGVIQCIVSTPPHSLQINRFNVYFALVFGWGGKTAINVFILITGYFMCRQQFKWRKVVFLALEIVLYRWLIYGIFLASGYESFNLKEFIKTVLVLPYDFGWGFSSSFVGLYVLVPFINKLLSTLEKKELEKLICVLLVFFTGFSTFLFNTSFEYIGWYVTVYLIGSYLRLYEMNWMCSRRITGLLCACSLAFSWLSVICIRFLAEKMNRNLPYYYFVADSNKVLAIATAISLFLLFKNINIGSNRLINKFSASTFGVLMIHASSDTMRRWLWQDVCKNTFAFATNSFIFHAVFCTLAVYIVCVSIDMVRKFFTDRILCIFSK
mgnify:FL=1